VPLFSTGFSAFTVRRPPRPRGLRLCLALSGCRFAVRVLLVLSALPLLVRAQAPAPAPSPAAVRSDKPEWARLRTSAPGWDRHSNIDHEMLEFFRARTSISVGKVWHAVEARIDTLNNFPFLFAESLVSLSPEERHTIGEYLRRGGFLLLDGCVNTEVNPDMARYSRDQLAVLQAELPELRVEDLPPRHEIFSIYFQLRQFPPTGSPGSRAPLRALVWENRVVGILSTSGLQCGRAGFGEYTARQGCTEMMANIYFYAITH
jgi:hypothetical protein